MCASTQPLATDIGLNMLKSGGNAMDAAVAMAAALNGAPMLVARQAPRKRHALTAHALTAPPYAVTEPTSTGIGGDCFCLYFDSKTGQVSPPARCEARPKSTHTLRRSTA